MGGQTEHQHHPQVSFLLERRLEIMHERQSPVRRKNVLKVKHGLSLSQCLLILQGLALSDKHGLGSVLVNMGSPANNNVT